MKEKINNLILRLNNHFGINILEFTKQGIFTSIPLISKSILAILVTIIFTRTMSQSIFGEYQFFIVILETLAIFALPGMDTALVQSAARSYDKSLIDTTLIKIKWSIMGSIALIILSIYFKILNIGNTSNSWIYLLLAALFFPFIYSLQSGFFYLQAKQKFNLYSKYLTSHFIIIHLFLISSIILTKDILIIILTYISATSISGLFFYIKIKKKFINEIIKSQKDPELFKFGFKINLITLIPLITSHADKIILAYLLGFKTLAIYTITLAFPSQIRLIIKPITKMILPKLSLVKDKSATYKFLRGKLIYIILFSITIILIGILLSPYIIRFLFPLNYNSAIIYAQLLFLSYLFTIPTHIFNQFLISQKKTKSIFKLNLYIDLSKLGLFALLIPLFGIMGAIISLIISNYLGFGLSLYFSKKISNR